MTSSSHEHLVELFRNRSELAPMLLQTCVHLELPHQRSDLGSVDLTQAMPIEYRADQVIRLYAADNTVSAAVIVEVQLGRDARKLRSWPVYLAALRARLDCDVFLLVVAPDKTVASWARQAIELGHPGFALRPIVLSADDIPRSFDPEDVTKLPELTVLSALTHVDRETISAAVAAIGLLPEDDRKLYWGFIQRAWSMRVPGTELELENHMGKLKYDEEKMDRFAIEWAVIMKSNRLFTSLQNTLIAMLEGKLGRVSDDERDVALDIYSYDEMLHVMRVVAHAAGPDEARAALAETRERTRKRMY